MADPSYRAVDLVSALPANPLVGAAGLAFHNKDMYVLDAGNGCLYEFDRENGGRAQNALNCFGMSIGGSGYRGLTSDHAGSLYITQQNPGKVFQVSAKDGSLIRTITDDIPGAASLVIDEQERALYVSGTDDTIYRFRANDGPKEAYARIEGSAGRAKDLALTRDGVLTRRPKTTSSSFPRRPRVRHWRRWCVRDWRTSNTLLSHPISDICSSPTPMVD